MGIDYYAILDVPREASTAQINEGYRRLALKWHPQKNPHRRDESESKFREIAEAYDVLSDGYKRATFDRVGEDGLKNGTLELNNSEYRGYQFVGDPFTVFTNVFGQETPFSIKGDVYKEKVGKVGEDIEQDLWCTLEELYTGCLKTVCVERRKNGLSAMEQKIISVPIQAGWTNDMKLTFKGEGHHVFNGVPGNIVFTLRQSPHSLYKVEGADLIYTVNLTLVDALCGHKPFAIPLLNGTTASIHVPDLASRLHTEKRVVGRGMPIADSPKNFGDLVLRWHVEYPDLSMEQKNQLREILVK